MNYRVWKYTGLIATVVIMLSIPLSPLLNRNSGPAQKPAVTFAGGKSCIECHQKEYQLWKGSDHDKAMDIATDSTVRSKYWLR